MQPPRRVIRAAHRLLVCAWLDTGGADLSVVERFTDHTVILPVYTS